MPDDKTVAVRLMASNDLFKKAMLDAEGSVKNLGSTVEGQFKKISQSSQAELGKASSASQRLGTQMMSIGAATTLMGVGILAVGFKMAGTFESVGKEVLKVQRYTGLAAEESSKLRFEAQQSGIDVDKLTKSLGLMAKGMENSPDKFTKMGIAVRDSSGQLRSTSDVLLDVADKVAGTSNATERLTIAQAAFGRSGADMLPILMKGRDGLQALGEQAQKYGLVLTGDNLNAVKQSIAAHREFDAAIQGLQVQIGSKFLPILTSATEALTGFIAGNRSAVGSVALWGGAALTAAGGVMILVGQLVKMKDTFTGLSSVSKTALGGLGALTAAAVVGAVAWDVFNGQMEKGAAKAKTFLKGMSDAGTSTADSINEAQDRITALEKTRTSSWNPFDNFNRKGEEEALIKARDQMKLNQQVALGLRDATGESYQATQKWVAEQERAGTVFPSVAAAVAAYTGHIDKSTLSAEDAAAATAAQQAELKGLNDQLHAMMDPLFGMQKALRDNEDAQRKATDAQVGAFLAQVNYNDVVRQYGENSSQARDAAGQLSQAQRDLNDANFAAASSAMDVNTAVNTLQYAMQYQGLTVDDARAKLELWVTQGLITQDQANQVSTSFGWLAGMADNLNTKNVNIPVDAPGLSGVNRDFATLAGWLDRVGAHYGDIVTMPDGSKGVFTSVGIAALPKANGGIVDQYVNGGIRSIESYANGGESHIAQIAPAGAMRLWAEPETGGEAYIPLSPAKRGRSAAIWAETGRRLGVEGGQSIGHVDNSRTVNVAVEKPNASSYEIGTQVLFDMATSR